MQLKLQEVGVDTMTITYNVLVSDQFLINQLSYELLFMDASVPIRRDVTIFRRNKDLISADGFGLK